MRTRTTYETCFDEQAGKQPPADECPECAGTLRTDSGETRCTDCGLVLEEHRLDRSGRPLYSSEDWEKKRTGGPRTETRHDRGLSTTIGEGTDGYGNDLSRRKRRQLSRLRREHSRAQFETKANRNLAAGCTEIARMTAALGLPRSIREQASSLFRTAQTNGLLPGRSIEGMAAGCVYAACRCNGLPRLLDEVGQVARVDTAAVGRAYRVLNRELSLPAPPRRPREFVPVHASELDLPASTERLAVQIAERAHENGLSIGPNPSGFAAGCLAVAAEIEDVPVRQLDLADVAGVAVKTVRSNRDAIRNRLSEWSL
jgi:transcription initiation factor TFIIB